MRKKWFKKASVFVLALGIALSGMTPINQVGVESTYAWPVTVFEIDSEGVLVSYNGSQDVKDVVVPNTVKIIGTSAFADKTWIKSVTLPGSVKEIGSMAFMNCTGLEKITLSEGLDVIAPWAFDGCTKLSVIRIPASVTNICPRAFVGCPALTSIGVASGNKNYISVNGVLYTKNLESLIACPATKQTVVVKEGTKWIEIGAFAGCTKLEYLVLPHSLQQQENYVLYDCKNLKGVYLPDELLRAFDNIEAFDVTPETCVGFHDEFSDVWDIMIHDYNMSGDNIDQRFFIDVPLTPSWKSDIVQEIASSGLMVGTDKYIFSPNQQMTRGQLVTILWRLAGQPDLGTASYSDVAANSYCAKAVAWAKAKGIAYGMKDGTFHPNDSVTREQFVTFLYRYTAIQKMMIGTTVTDKEAYKACSDYSQVSTYAVEMVNWAVENGLIGANGTINPKGTTTRLEAATMLYRYLVKNGLMN